MLSKEIKIPRQSTINNNFVNNCEFIMNLLCIITKSGMFLFSNIAWRNGICDTFNNRNKRKMALSVSNFLFKLQSTTRDKDW